MQTRPRSSRCNGAENFKPRNRPSQDAQVGCCTSGLTIPSFEDHLKPGTAFPAGYYGSRNHDARCALAHGRYRLVSLQPAVRVDDNTLEAALVLLHAAGAWDRCSLVACMWLAMKLLAVRTAAPCRGLLCAATSVSPTAISIRELEICKALDWDMSAILRAAGVVC